MGRRLQINKDGLTPRQERFVGLYLIDLKSTEAALKAGYSEKSAKLIGEQLLKRPAVKMAIAAGKKIQLDKCGLSAMRVLEEYRRLAFFDLRTLFDHKGNIKPICDWTEDMGSAVSGVDVVIKNVAAGDGHVDTVHKLKVWDKTRALEGLGKHFGLLIERMEISGADLLVSRLAGGRQRAALTKIQEALTDAEIVTPEIPPE